MYSADSENVAEHSHNVAAIAFCLGVINNVEFKGNANPDKLASAAVFHETSEVITGDLPTPIKYFNPRVKESFKELEGIAEEKLLSYLPPKLQDAFKDAVSPCLDEYSLSLLKGADKLSALIKCVEELKMGNKEFQKAKAATLCDLEKLNLPEVKYFIDNFIAAFELTLDELDS